MNAVPDPQRRGPSTRRSLGAERFRVDAGSAGVGARRAAASRGPLVVGSDLLEV